MGAILAFAVSATVAGLNIGLILTMVLLAPRRHRIVTAASDFPVGNWVPVQYQPNRHPEPIAEKRIVMTTAPEATVTPEPVLEPTPEPTSEAVVAPDVATPPAATWTASEWLGKVLVDRDGERIGKLQDVYVDVESDAPMFGTVKEGFFDRHLTFVPLVGVEVGPDQLRVTALKEKVKSAPDLDLHGQEMSQADESALYHHFEMNYTAIASDSGRRLARR